MTRTSLWWRWLPTGLVVILALTTMPEKLSGFTYTEDRAEHRAQDCTLHILEAEKQYNIPSGLLLSLALVESGRSGKPYPWALNISGRSFYLESPQEAVNKMTDRRGNIRRNTMAGCMQLSVFLHGRHFDSVEQVLDPQQNVDYAARYLKRHYERYGNWISAVKRYNGGTAVQKRNYACRIWNTWEKLDTDEIKTLSAPSCKTRLKSAAIAPEIQSMFARYTLAQAE